MNETSGKSSYASTIAIAISCALVTALTTLWIYHCHFAPRIVTVDLQGYLHQQRTLVAEGKVPEEAWRNGLDALDQQLEALPANHVILLKEVVLRNGEELPLP